MTEPITADDVLLAETAGKACLGDDYYFAGPLGEIDYTDGRQHRLAARYTALAAKLAALASKP